MSSLPLSLGPSVYERLITYALTAISLLFFVHRQLDWISTSEGLSASDSNPGVYFKFYEFALIFPKYSNCRIFSMTADHCWRDIYLPSLDLRSRIVLFLFGSGCIALNRWEEGGLRWTILEPESWACRRVQDSMFYISGRILPNNFACLFDVTFHLPTRRLD